MSESLLGRSFFGLSSKHISNILEEFFYLSKQNSIQYSEFLKIPTYVRRFLIDKLIKDISPPEKT